MTTPNTALGPYSPIFQAGELFFVSGCTGINISDKTAGPDITTQTHQALANLEAVLQSRGLELADVVKTTVFLTDMGDFAAMNDVYITKFSEPRPARSTVAVAELPRVAQVPLKVEIEAVARRSQN